MAPALPFIAIAAAVIAAAGTAVSAISASNAASYNAQVADNEADYAKQAAEAQAEQHQRDVAKQLGSIRANYGASGVTMEGSPLDILGESARSGELDRLTILNQGYNQATGYSNSATLDRYRASSSLTSGMISASGTLLGGVASGVSKMNLGSDTASTYDTMMMSRTGGY